MTSMNRSLLEASLALFGMAAASCMAETQDGESYAVTTQAVVGQHTFLYFLCNATAWAPTSATRLVPGASPEQWTITYDVTQAWMTTGWDTCTLVETNQHNGWGTQQKFYDKTGAQRLTVPPSAPGIGQYVLAQPGQDYHFNAQYPALGRFKLTVSLQDKTFSIVRVDASKPTGWLWPVPGQDGEAWVINNYVDLDASASIRDYQGGAKSYDGHAGTDIDIPSFREMDLGQPVIAAGAGNVIGIEDRNYDRNTSCQGEWNYVTILTDNGYQVTYGHLKRDSVVVNVGNRVEAGATLGMVGSSGCSTWPHLHFEVVRSADGSMVDPFRNGLWAAAPTYNPPLTVMGTVVTDQEIVSTDTIADPPASVTRIARGGWLAIGINAAGGSIGDHLGITVKQSDGATFQSADIAMPESARHTLWYYNWIVGTGAPTGIWTVQILINGTVTKTHTVQVN